MKYEDFKLAEDIVANIESTKALSEALRDNTDLSLQKITLQFNGRVRTVKVANLGFNFQEVVISILEKELKQLNKSLEHI